jgi:hypothetical protein
VQPAEIELSLADPAEQFDPGDDNRRGAELLEAKHRADAELDAAMVMLVSLSTEMDVLSTLSDHGI